MFFAVHALTTTGSRYDPDTRTVTLGANPTPYQLAHERAHGCQHEHGTRAWRIGEACARLPYLSRITRLAVEIQAARMALSALQRIGIRDRAADREAWRGIGSYVRALFL